MSPKDRVALIVSQLNNLEHDGYDVEPHDGYVDIIDTTMRDHGTGNPRIARISHGGASWLVLD